MNFKIKGTVACLVTSLEMHTPQSAYKMHTSTQEVSIQKIPNISVELYRTLYMGVGKNFNWTERLLMSDEELTAIINDPLVEVFVISVANKFAGYIELDHRVPDEIEIAYFGIFTEFHGSKLGAYLLNFGIAKAWESKPKRLWVHTCDLDHPSALQTYIKAGFIPYKTELGSVRIIDWDA